jgi:glycerol kinase
VVNGAPALILALDQGGHASRAVLFDGEGRQVAQAQVPVSTRHEGPDRVVQSPDELVATLKTAISDACEAVAAHGMPVAAAGLATQRSTIVCWQRSSGRPLTDALSWQDRRNAAWLGRLRPEAERIRALTGLVLSPHYGASKMRWCLDHAEAVQRSAAADDLALGPLSSFLLFRLLEEQPLVVDPANAARTSLFDPLRLDWSPVLLDLFGIAVRHLPRCVPTRFDYGTLAISGRAVPLRACTGDQSAAAFAFGKPDAATALVNIGTGAFVQRAAEADAPLPDGLLKSVLCSDGSHATCSHEGTVNGAGSALEWFAGRTALDVERALGSLRPDSSREPPLFMNGVGGLGAPFWRPDFPIEFVGEGDDLRQLAAVVESVAFLLGENLVAMQASAPLRRIVISGGLSRCDYLCRALADLSALPVERYTLREATARGVAFLAAGQPDAWSRPQVDRVFVPVANPSLDARRGRWRAEMARRGGK